MIYREYLDSPIGILVIECDSSHLLSITMTDCMDDSNANQVSNQVKSELTQYFNGELTEFRMKVSTNGSPFQQEIWNKLLSIEYGKTISYIDFAHLCGKPKAVRAVASAIAKNPIPIIIPCHRVVKKDGSIGGFIWGSGSKSALLEIENKKYNNKKE
ncbi:MAG: methylated-DNA--[protein]-cysteine S-methyltransferase [Bacteroidales bacterium]